MLMIIKTFCHLQHVLMNHDSTNLKQQRPCRCWEASWHCFFISAVSCCSNSRCDMFSDSSGNEKWLIHPCICRRYYWMSLGALYQTGGSKGGGSCEVMALCFQLFYNFLELCWSTNVFKNVPPLLYFMTLIILILVLHSLPLGTASQPFLKQKKKKKKGGIEDGNQTNPTAKMDLLRET